MSIVREQGIPIVAFTDLDDTLFSSLRKQAQDDTSLIPVAYLKDGSPVSYTDARQRALLRWLEICSRVVPVTARSLSAFRRVDVPFSSYAVISHGATVLAPGGNIDASWTATVATRLHEARPLMLSLRELLSTSAINADGQLFTQVVKDEGRAVYVVAKHIGKNASVIERLANEVAMPWLLANPGYRLHTNGNNLAILPPGISKAIAAAYVQQRLREELGHFMSIGLGDSLTDAAFMLDCDFALMPARSQLANTIGGTCT